MLAAHQRGGLRPPGRRLHELRGQHETIVPSHVGAGDQPFGAALSEGVHREREVLPRLKDDYKRAYYAGIICERRAKALLHRSSLGAADVAVEWFREAMSWYEQAESLRPAGNDESILRWNTCVRLLGRHEPSGRSAPREYEPALEE